MKKIQLVLNDEAIKTLTELQEQTGAGSMTGVLRDALGVYSSLHSLLTGRPGLELAIIDKRAGEFQQLTVTSFQRGHVVLHPKVTKRGLSGGGQ